MIDIHITSPANTGPPQLHSSRTKPPRSMHFHHIELPSGSRTLKSLTRVPLDHDLAYHAVFIGFERRLTIHTCPCSVTTMLLLKSLYQVPGRKTWIAESINFCSHPPVTNLRVLAELYVQYVQKTWKKNPPRNPSGCRNSSSSGRVA